MQKNVRYRADSLSQWIISFLIAVCAIALFFIEDITVAEWKQVVSLVCGVLLSVYSLCRIFCAVYISGSGVECCRFGSVYRTLLWDDILEVCIIRD